MILVNHNHVTGSCNSCHNGSNAQGQPGGHFITAEQCGVCHSTSTWTPAAYTHASPFFPNGGRHLNLSCDNCHIGNSQTNVWSTPVYQPDCAGCHANDFDQNKHPNETVSDLRDCTGACHMAPSHHQVFDQGWDR